MSAQEPFGDNVYTPTARDLIIAQLIELDTKSVSPRVMRESTLGNTTYLASLEAQAVALRAKLATLQ